MMSAYDTHINDDTANHIVVWLIPSVYRLIHIILDNLLLLQLV